MKVPVLWVSRHPEILARHYSDQGLFEAILAREVWTPADPITFEHHEVRGDFPDVEGALVVVPARHHASPEDMSWLLHQLDALAWSVVLLSGDEEWAFDWRFFLEMSEPLDLRKVWVMQPRPEHIEAGLTGFPGGWYPGTHEGVRDVVDRYRDLDWMFAGQVTHKRREECAAVLWPMLDSRSRFLGTEGYLQGMPQETYWDFMARSKVIPCPSGPMTVDTARAFEALEAGCVPVVDMVTARGEDYDYWSLLFDEEAKVLPPISDWSSFRPMLGVILERWPLDANRCSAMWQQAKRRWAKQLDADLRAVSGQPSTSTDPNDLITAVITTSPTPGDPSTDNIATTVESIRAHLPTAEIVIVCDGVRPEQEAQTAAYQEYVRRLLWRCNFDEGFSNVVPIVLDEWGHQANALRAGLELVDSPLVLFVEHDVPIDVHPIDWQGICDVVRQDGPVNVVRLHHEKVWHPDHDSVMLDPEPVDYDGVPLKRTAAFWARPHLARADWYRDVLTEWFPPESRTMIEDRLYSPCYCAWRDRGEDGWAEWGLTIYAPSEPHPQRSTHLDSRGSQPKFQMDFGDSPRR